MTVLKPYETEADLRVLPTWLQLIVHVLFKFGVPSAIAIYLVWMGAANLPALRLEMAAQHREIQQVQQTLTVVQAQTAQIQLLLQWICSNTASTDVEKRACFQR